MRLPLSIVTGSMILLLSACGGSALPASPAAGTPHPPPFINLRLVPTTAGTPAPGGVRALAAALSDPAVLPLEDQPHLQALVPQTFGGASAIDMLRLSAGAGVGPTTAQSLLTQLDLRWLASQTALGTLADDAFHEWRVSITAFGSAGSAGRYLARPFLLPAALLQATPQPQKGPLPSAAVLLRAPDTIVRVNDPARVEQGERAALLWQEGSLVLTVEESTTPAGTDLDALLRLAQALDRSAAPLAAVAE